MYKHVQEKQSRFCTGYKSNCCLFCCAFYCMFFRMNRIKDRRREGCKNVISAFPVPSLLCVI